ncbi:hypothetical protein [Burkholderia sp. Z1]|uniref:hypothetical protein n=1 Tax=Burkholderia sp. Z1 TaxID=2759039 RepID=UPI0018663175|nr:hypothetical protein [Burkholderia sp. Z1]
MAIIGTLPVSLQNGTNADASQVMSDLNFIVNQVNANANPSGTLTAPSGTSMAFQQATAPAGWVAQTGAAYLDAFLRCITPSGFANTSGTNPSTTLIVGPISGNGHALTVAEMPSHNHVDAGHVHGVNDPSHTHAPGTGSSFYTNAGGPGNYGGGPTQFNLASTTAASTTGISIQTGAANIQNTGSGNAHSHTMTANCKFVDQIIAVKS